MKKSLATIAAMAFMPLMILAHEGHGSTDGYTIIHYFVEPFHMLIALLISAFAIILFIWHNRKVRE